MQLFKLKKHISWCSWKFKGSLYVFTLLISSTACIVLSSSRHPEHWTKLNYCCMVKQLISPYLAEKYANNWPLSFKFHRECIDSWLVHQKTHVLLMNVLYTVLWLERICQSNMNTSQMVLIHTLENLQKKWNQKHMPLEMNI